MIIDLFKVGVYREYLMLNNEEITKYCYNIKEKQKSKNISNKGGFHSDNLNLNDMEIKDLLNEINRKANFYSKEIGYGDVIIDNIWCNINSYKDYNELHCHPNAKISGVYYVKTPEDCGDI